ncbi:hypothetical protein [Burkholderia sp. Ac-20365]|uniref:hypothetical protein n=1 Tax=Burkholderia sp. Ac-20365 TaxID=2703897 RepID=UPI00197CB33A|nr:hypothetical protein [Burkholderia sp. Ac-20365]MBN3761291.1 hypothetical protein [Burkholderia sp. Ac-20365]
MKPKSARHPLWPALSDQIADRTDALLRAARPVYDWVMTKISTFTAANGRHVQKVVTDAGTTGFVDSGVPVEAMPGFLERIELAERENTAETRRVLDEADAKSRLKGA